MTPSWLFFQNARSPLHMRKRLSSNRQMANVQGDVAELLNNLSAFVKNIGGKKRNRKNWAKIRQKSKRYKEDGKVPQLLCSHDKTRCANHE